MTEPSDAVLKSHPRVANDLKGSAKLYRCPNSIWAIKVQVPTMEYVFQTQAATFLNKRHFVFTNPQE
jgi:hypothetical protein